jgi:hypothetical protein
VLLAAEPLAAGVGGQDGAPLRPVEQRDQDFAVEPAGSAQRRIQGVWPVGDGQHHHPGSWASIAMRRVRAPLQAVGRSSRAASLSSSSQQRTISGELR